MPLAAGKSNSKRIVEARLFVLVVLVGIEQAITAIDRFPHGLLHLIVELQALGKQRVLVVLAAQHVLLEGLLVRHDGVGPSCLLEERLEELLTLIRSRLRVGGTG